MDNGHLHYRSRFDTGIQPEIMHMHMVCPVSLHYTPWPRCLAALRRMWLVNEG
jgi:hypothetical protein